jgi:hypothetical protein
VNQVVYCFQTRIPTLISELTKKCFSQRNSPEGNFHPSQTSSTSIPTRTPQPPTTQTIRGPHSQNSGKYDDTDDMLPGGPRLEFLGRKFHTFGSFFTYSSNSDEDPTTPLLHRRYQDGPLTGFWQVCTICFWGGLVWNGGSSSGISRTHVSHIWLIILRL